MKEDVEEFLKEIVNANIFLDEVILVNNENDPLEMGVVECELNKSNFNIKAEVVCGDFAYQTSPKKRPLYLSPRRVTISYRAVGCEVDYSPAQLNELDDGLVQVTENFKSGANIGFEKVGVVLGSEAEANYSVPKNSFTAQGSETSGAWVLRAADTPGFLTGKYPDLVDGIIGSVEKNSMEASLEIVVKTLPGEVCVKSKNPLLGQRLAQALAVISDMLSEASDRESKLKNIVDGEVVYFSRDIMKD